MDDWYLIEGINPEPWEAPQGSIGRAKGSGKQYVQMHKTSTQRTYQEAVSDYMKKQNPEMTLDNVALEFFFWRDLPETLVISEKKDRKTRGHIADATNLQKSTEDALQGILFKNDNQVVQVRSVIMEQGRDVYPRILIHLFEPKVELDAILRADELRQDIPEQITNERDFDVEETF